MAELELQSLWTKGTAPGDLPRGSLGELHALSTLPQRILTHGVGAPIGGTLCDQERHTGQFRRWTEELRAPWTSEHLSVVDVTGINGPQFCGFLMPPPQTDEQVALAVTNITQRAATLGKPFAFETGVNYFAPRAGEMEDGDFFAAIAEQADCGILLDLNNLWCNQKNGRATVQDVLKRLPLDRVWEIHVAGAEFAHGYLLDAHSGAIDPELVAIAAEVVASLPNLGAIVFEVESERMGSFGSAAFLHQIETLHRLWAIKRPSVSPPAPVVSAGLSLGPSPKAWERWIAVKMLPPAVAAEDDEREPALNDADRQSFALYANLVTSFRNGAIAELLPNSTRLLLLAIGEDALRELLKRYVAITAPSIYPTDEALNFARFAEGHALSVPGLTDVLRFEAAAVMAAADSSTIRVEVRRDIDLVLKDIAQGRLPAASSESYATMLEIGVQPEPFVRAISVAEKPQHAPRTDTDR